MAFNYCPADVVAAPVESVWELLAEPTLYDEWWDAHVERIVPEGKASPGQVLYAKTSAFGRKWAVTIKIGMVNPEKHQIQFHVMLPMGAINDQTTTCTAIDATSCRVQFG
jgi:hypothetical protein